MKRFMLWGCLILLLSGCGTAASEAVFKQRVFEEIDYEGSVTLRNDWRLKTFTTEDDLKILVVSGTPKSHITYFEIKERSDGRLKDFTWEEGWEGHVQLRNTTPDYFQEVCEWLEDEGDWDEIDSDLRWEDSWIQSVIAGSNPYRRYENIHEVWVIDTELQLDGVEREPLRIEHMCCLLGLPLVAFSFWPEHHEVAQGRLSVKVYDPLNRKFRSKRAPLEVSKSRRRLHSPLKDIVGYLTFGMFNFSSRGTFLWIPLYGTDSTPILSDVLDEMESGEFEEGVVDHMKSATVSRPDQLPASLRIRSQKGYVDSSNVLIIPIDVVNQGRGKALNVRVNLTTPRKEVQQFAPSLIELGDIGPNDRVNYEIRFKLPDDLKEREIQFTLEPIDESAQKFRKLRIRVPLKQP